MSNMEKRITIKLNSIKRSLTSEDDGKFKRSQTMGAPTLGSWLVNDKKSFLEENDENENESQNSRRSFKEEEIEKPIITQVDSEQKKKEAEEQSAKVRSMLSKYTRASSLGAVETPAKRSSWLDEDNNKKPSILTERPKRKSSNESSDKERGRRGKSSPLVMDKAHSSSEGEDYNPLAVSNASAGSFSLKTRLTLREEDIAYKERREKEKEEEEKMRESRLSSGKKIGNTSDIGAIARAEMKKIERSDIGKISALYSKYTGKSVSVSKDEKKDMEEEKVPAVTEPVIREKRVLRGKMEEEEEVKTRRSSSRRKMDEEFSSAEEKDEDLAIKKRGGGRLARGEKPKEEVSASKGLKESEIKNKKETAKKLETPAKVLDRSSTQTSLTKTPATVGTPSMMRSSFLSKYLDSASSEASPEGKKGTAATASSGIQKEVRNLRSKFNEEEEEEQMTTKVIKKKTSIKDEKTVFFTGFSSENVGKAKEFCEKFGLKYLEDEVRNLSRAEMLVYDGKEMPKKFKNCLYNGAK